MKCGDVILCFCVLSEVAFASASAHNLVRIIKFYYVNYDPERPCTWSIAF